MDQLNNDSKNVFKQWLEKLQQESWQLELLISGFALFGIYSARTVITDLEFYQDMNLSGELYSLASMFIYIIKMGWLIFFINLIIHVVLRGLWIGAIGLRYVSNEINFEELNYAPLFETYLKNKVGSYDDFIERLEKICSVLFAFTFLLFLLFMSLMVYIMHIVLISILISKYVEVENNILPPILGVFLLSYVILGLVVAIDMITLGGLKKINQKQISKIYFYIYRYFSFTTLSFLYRPLLYNFIDNPYTKKLFYLSIPYIFIVLGGYSMFENTFNPYKPGIEIAEDMGILIDANYYDDLRNEKLNEHPNDDRKVSKEKLPWVSLEKFNIHGNISSIFFKTTNNQINIMEKDSTLIPYKSRGIKFGWFNLNKKEDLKEEELKKLKEKELAELIKSKKEIKKVYGSQKELLKSKVDSIEQLITSKNKLFSDKISQYQKDKILAIKSKFTSNYSFFLDSVSINLDQCYYYNHPNYNEHGIRCFFRTDSLATGNHYMKIIRKILSKKDEQIEKDSIILPILKH